MDTQAVDDAVPLGMGSEIACLKGTGKGRWGGVLGELVGVFVAEVEFQGLLLKEGFMAVRTVMRVGVLVLFHMIVHRVLALLGHTAGGADELSRFVSVIDEGHGLCGLSGLSGCGLG